jgi:hypothetical protein
MGPAEDHVAVALARAVHRLQPTIPVAVLAVGARLSLISVGQHRLDQGPRGGGLRGATVWPGRNINVTCLLGDAPLKLGWAPAQAPSPNGARWPRA